MKLSFRGRPGWSMVAALAAGLALGELAVAGTVSQSRLPALAAIAAGIGLVVVITGRARQLLLLAVVLDTALQWSIDLGYRSQAAQLGALPGVNFSITTLALAGLYGLWAADRSHAASRTPSLRWRPALPLIAFVAVNALSIIGARNRTLSGFEMALLVQTLLLFVYVVSTVRSRDDVTFVATALVGSLLLESLLIIFLKLTGYQFHLLGLKTAQAGGITAADVRLAGTLGSPNDAGSFLALLLPLALVMLVAPVRTTARRLALAAVPTAIVALVVTGSRGSWLSAAISAAILGFWVVRTRQVSITAALGVLAVTVALVIPLWGTISDRIEHADPRSAQSRITLTKLAWKMIQAHPVLGVGVNNVPANIPSYAGPEFDGQWLYAVHDKYLLVWAEAGIGALLAFVWFLLATFRRGIHVVLSRDRLLSPLALGLTAGLIGEAVHMFVDLFESRAAVQSEWLVAALLAAMATIIARQRETAR